MHPTTQPKQRNIIKLQYLQRFQSTSMWLRSFRVIGLPVYRVYRCLPPTGKPTSAVQEAFSHWLEEAKTLSTALNDTAVAWSAAVFSQPKSDRRPRKTMRPTIHCAEANSEMHPEQCHEDLQPGRNRRPRQGHHKTSALPAVAKRPTLRLLHCLKL